MDLDDNGILAPMDRHMVVRGAASHPTDVLRIVLDLADIRLVVEEQTDGT